VHEGLVDRLVDPHQLVDDRALRGRQVLLDEPRDQLVITCADRAGARLVILHALHLGMQGDVAHERRLLERERAQLRRGRLLRARRFQCPGKRRARGLVEDGRCDEGGQHDREHRSEAGHEAGADAQVPEVHVGAISSWAVWKAPSLSIAEAASNRYPITAVKRGAPGLCETSQWAGGPVPIVAGRTHTTGRRTMVTATVILVAAAALALSWAAKA